MPCSTQRDERRPRSYPRQSAERRCRHRGRSRIWRTVISWWNCCPKQSAPGLSLARRLGQWSEACFEYNLDNRVDLLLTSAVSEFLTGANLRGALCTGGIGTLVDSRGVFSLGGHYLIPTQYSDCCPRALHGERA